MQEIMVLNPENVGVQEAETYGIREAARAVVIDEQRLVALLHVSKDEYYKLPGGGLEDAEDPIAALKRECQEEIGCDIQVMNEIGMITEYRKKYSLKQVSYCYVVKVIGGKSIPAFTDDEIKHGFKVVWLAYEKAKEAMERSRLSEYESVYIVPRDKALLEAARYYFSS